MKHSVGTRCVKPVRGVSLLEAIVALAILGSTGLALFAWLQQSLETASRLRAINREARLMLDAQALIETVNPLVQPRGERRAGEISVRWQAEPLEAPRPNSTFFPGALGPWQLGLFRLDVQAQDERAAIQVRIAQWRVGSQRLAPVEVLR